MYCLLNSSDTLCLRFRLVVGSAAVGWRCTPPPVSSKDGESPWSWLEPLLTPINQHWKTWLHLFILVCFSEETGLAWIPAVVWSRQVGPTTLHHWGAVSVLTCWVWHCCRVGNWSPLLSPGRRPRSGRGRMSSKGFPPSPQASTHQANRSSPTTNVVSVQGNCEKAFGKVSQTFIQWTTYLAETMVRVLTSAKTVVSA